MPVALHPDRPHGTTCAPKLVGREPVLPAEMAGRVHALRAELTAWFARHLPEGFAHEAEDLVQDVALVAVRQSVRFVWRGPDQFRGWVYTIARTRRAKWMTRHTAAKRTIRRREAAKEEGGAVPERPAPPDPASGPLRRAERYAKLLASLETHLDARSHRLLTLKFIEARSDAEITALTGLSAVAARQAVHRALVKMRCVLNPSDFVSPGE